MSNDPQRVSTGNVRLSYVNLLAPRAKKPGDPLKYSCTILIPKHDMATKQRIDAAINATILDGTARQWGGIRPPVLSFPIHDGDGVRPSDGMPFGEECRGHWVLTASSKAEQKPDLVDLNMNPILNPNEIYSGMFARISFRFFPFNNNGKKGIGCGLGNVQKLEGGERLSGSGATAASDFGGAPAAYGAPAAGYGAPATPAPGYPAPQQPAFPQQGYAQPPAYPAPQQPAYPPQAPAYPPQPGYGQPQQPQPQPQAYPQQPTYPPQPGYVVPVQPGYPPQQPAYPPQTDPITGLPLQGPIMGI